MVRLLTCKENENGQSNAAFDWIVIAKILSFDNNVAAESAPAVENAVTETNVTEAFSIISETTSTDITSVIIELATTTEVVGAEVSSAGAISSSTLATE